MSLPIPVPEGLEYLADVLWWLGYRGDPTDGCECLYASAAQAFGTWLP